MDCKIFFFVLINYWRVYLRCQRRQRSLSRDLTTQTFSSLQALQLDGVVPKIKRIQPVQLPRIEWIALFLFLAHFNVQSSLTTCTSLSVKLQPYFVVKVLMVATARAPWRHRTDWAGLTQPNRKAITARHYPSFRIYIQSHFFRLASTRRH